MVVTWQQLGCVSVHVVDCYSSAQRQQQLTSSIVVPPKTVGLGALEGTKDLESVAAKATGDW